MLIAMHMANELLDIPTAAITIALAVAAVLVAGHRVGKSMDVSKAPLMGVMGAFIFAAQMINFPVLPGTSGHLIGSVLLAILLGPWAAIVTMTAILMIQCLLFQDGGLLALGCNVLNMAVAPSLLGWWIYRGILGMSQKATAGRQYLAAWAAAMAAVLVGAAMVPLETHFGGRLPLPTASFLAVMIAVHLPIALAEGVITFAVLAYLRKVRPEVLGLEPAEDGASRRVGAAAVLASLLVTAGLLAGVASWFACSWPDGLESALASGRSAASHGSAQAAGGWPNIGVGQSAWAVAGTLVTLAVVYLIAVVLRRRRLAAERFSIHE